jgi:hypothetical protein
MDDLMQNEEERKTELDDLEEKNESMVYEESVRIQKIIKP